jgi:hypothetical protein
MSRITDGPVHDGDVLDAASLNDRFSSYTQTDLNQFNHRDAAHDLPQFDAGGWLLTHAQSVQIGDADWKHSSSTNVAGMTSMPAAAHPVEDGAGTPTVMSFGAGGLTIAAGEVFRAYWNLSVFANPGSNWDTAGSLAYNLFQDGSLGSNPSSTWGAVWVTYLEWDVTDSSLTNWVPVFGQQDFTTVIGSKYGAPLANTRATAAVPADLRWARDPNGAYITNPDFVSTQRWRGLSGAYFHAPASPITLYGLRVVIKGVMHPYSVGSTNYLVHDTTFSTDAVLSYNAGNLAVLKHLVQ